MELFSVTCITCRAKLKVRHVSAIGQILPCPRCQGMVQIAAPPGWQPPTAQPERPADEPAAPGTAAPALAATQENAASAASSHDEPLTAPLHQASPAEVRLRRILIVGGGCVAAAILGFGLWSTLGRNRESDNVPTIAAEQSPTATAAATNSTTGTAAKPEPTRAVPSGTAATATPPPKNTLPVSAAQALQRPVTFRAESIALLPALHALSQEIGAPIDVAVDDLKAAGIAGNETFAIDEPRQPAESVLRKLLTLAAGDDRLAYVVRSAASGREAITITTRAAAAARNEPLPATFASVSSPPIAIAAPSATVTGPSVAATLPVVGATATGPNLMGPNLTGPNLTGPAPSVATAPVGTPPRPNVPVMPQLLPPPPTIDLSARLGERMPELALQATTLKQAVALLSRLSTIRISYDWDSLADAAPLDRSITLKLNDLTTEEALNRILATQELETRTFGDQLIVQSPPADEGVTTQEYVIADLTGTNDEEVQRLSRQLRTFVAPETWTSTGGRGSIAVAASKLTVEQSPLVQAEMALFLDRLRQARRRGASTKLSVDTRMTAARDVLAKPVSMNFRPGVDLETVVAHLEQTTGAVITIDYPALMSAGFQGSEPIGCSADKHPLNEVLTALCEPREWAWRVVGPHSFDITTRESLRRRAYVEFYPLPTIEGGESGAALAARLRLHLADDGRRNPEQDIAIDAASNTLIVRLHQEAHRRVELFLRESYPEPAAAAALPSNATPPSPTPPSPTPTGTAQTPP